MDCVVLQVENVQGKSGSLCQKLLLPSFRQASISSCLRLHMSLVVSAFEEPLGCIFSLASSPTGLFFSLVMASSATTTSLELGLGPSYPTSALAGFFFFSLLGPDPSCSSGSVLCLDLTSKSWNLSILNYSWGSRSPPKLWTLSWSPAQSVPLLLAYTLSFSDASSIAIYSLNSDRIIISSYLNNKDVAVTQCSLNLEESYHNLSPAFISP